MWNRTRALRELGVTLDVVATVDKEPPSENREQAERFVRKLFLAKRESGRKGLLSLRAGHAAIRSSLRNVPLEEEYDAVILQTEFASDILANLLLRRKATVIRVDNDEFRYHLATAKAEPSLVLEAYYLFEALRVGIHSRRVPGSVDMLWFVSHDEMEAHRKKQKGSQSVAFILPQWIFPFSIDSRLKGSRPCL